MSRSCTLTLKTISGSIDTYYVKLSGHTIINAEGEEQCSWEGPIRSSSKEKLEVKVRGIGSAEYELVIKIDGANVGITNPKALKDGEDRFETDL